MMLKPEGRRENQEELSLCWVRDTNCLSFKHTSHGRTFAESFWCFQTTSITTDCTLWFRRWFGWRGTWGGQPNLASNNKHPFCIYICPLSSQDRNGGALALAVEQGVLSPKRQSRVMVEELATGPQHLKPIRELWNIPQGSSIFATGHHKDPHRDGCCDSDTDKQSTR